MAVKWIKLYITHSLSEAPITDPLPNCLNSDKKKKFNRDMQLWKEGSYHLNGTCCHIVQATYNNTANDHYK